MVAAGADTHPPPLRLRYEVEGEVRTVDLAGASVSLGRGLDNRVVLPDPSVSRHHAEIRRQDGDWVVHDLESTNGLSLNDRKVEVAPLAAGDRLGVGAVEIRLEAVSADEPPPADEPDDDLASATIVRRLDEMPTGMLAGTGALRAEKRRALEAAYSNEVFGYLTRLAGALLRTDSLEQVLRQVVDVAFEALPVERGFIFLRSGGDFETTRPGDAAGPAGGLACELARRGDTTEVRPDLEVPVSRTLLRAVVEQGVALVTPDAAEDLRLAGAESVLMHRVRSALAAPLWSGERIVGVLLLDSPSRPGSFTEQDVELAAALANFAAVAIERIRWAERVEHERFMRSRLERYHSPAVIDDVLSRARSGRLPLREAEVSVLFADVVGFTGFAEAAPPEEVRALLEGFFRRSVEAIFDAGGTLDKFIGDCVMAFFGAPVAQDDHARRAMAAAMAIREAMAAWNRQREEEGRAPVEVRVAVHSGPVMVGEVGSERRVDYTVLGNTVNVTARLEENVARPGDVVLSEETRVRVGSRLAVEALGAVQLPGLRTPVTAYRLRESGAEGR